MRRGTGINRNLIRFSANGRPIPQGSLKHIGKGRMIHQRAAELATWRAIVALAAKQAGCYPIEGAININLTFRLKKPKSVKREQPSVMPDLDRLVRGVGDSLTGVAYVDDGQIVEIHARKIYAEPEGVDVEITGGFDVL